MERPIPNNAKKVFEGVLFDVYHWQQEMFDGSFQTFEAIERLGSVQVIAVKEDKILMLKERQPYVGEFTSLVGGLIEVGETHFESAKKELLEEVNMISDNIILWETKSFGSKIYWPTYYYIAKDCNLVEYKNHDQGIGEDIDVYQVSFEDFLEETQKPEFRNKFLSDMIFRIIHTHGELEKFKKLLFE